MPDVARSFGPDNNSGQAIKGGEIYDPQELITRIK
jgi:hypothetical protein